MGSVAGISRVGSSLVEVLISLFLLSLITVTCGGLYLVALREARSHYYFSVGLQQIKNMHALLSVASTMDLVSAVERWNRQNIAVLPQGRGSVRGQYPHYTVSIYWGDEEKLPIKRLKESVKKFHPELEHKFIKLDAPEKNATSLNLKSQMFDLSPFEETLFLDIDTVVLDKLDFGFEKAREFGIAYISAGHHATERYGAQALGAHAAKTFGIKHIHVDIPNPV